MIHDIFILVEHDERVNFFKKITTALQEKGHTCHLLTNRLSSFFHFRSINGEKIALRNIEYPTITPESNLSESIDVLTKNHTLDRAKNIYSAVYNQAERLIKNNSSCAIMTWNGMSTISMAATDAFKKNNKKTLFCELGNFPGKTFIDTDGVNSRSSIYKKPASLDAFREIDNPEWEKWKEAYFAKSNLPPKQATLSKGMRVDFFIDMVGQNFGGLINPVSKKILSRLTDYLFKKSPPQKIKYSSHFGNKYAFLPLQVSNDTQVMLNSSVDNFQALKIAKEYCTNKKIQLVTKLHPAEPNQEFILEIARICEKEKITLSNEGTGDLIADAEKVFTINSTVGMQALIAKKPIEVFGEAIYKNFSESQLRKYLIEYLFDIDYFDKKSASARSVERLEALLK